MSTIPPDLSHHMDTAPPPDTGRDPGSRPAAVLAWVLGLLAFAVVFWTNQCEGPPKPTPTAQPATVEPPSTSDPFVLTAKIAVKFNATGRDPALAEMLMSQVDGGAQGPADRVRAAMIAAELSGGEAARQRLPKLSGEIAADTAITEDAKQILTADVTWLDAHLADPANHSAPPPDGWVDRHGYCGKVALSVGTPDTDPQRVPLLAGGERIILVAALAGGLFTASFITGSILLLMWIMRSPARRPRAFVAPAPGGSVYVETAAVFFLAFAALHLLAPLVLTKLGLSLFHRLAIQWVLALVILWPLARGVPFERYRREIGLHAGRGVLREIGAGIYAYLAGFPLLVGAFLIAMLAILVQHFLTAGPHEPPSNPVQEMVAKADPPSLAMLFVLATVWAPLVEETVFRGALFRHLRARVPMFVAAAATALAFGSAHGYPLPLLLPIITIGFIFAVVREHRDSLIASMTGHFLHNAVTLGLAFSLFSALGD